MKISRYVKSRKYGPHRGIYTNIAKTAIASLYFQCYNPITYSGHPRVQQNIGSLRCGGGGCTRAISGPRPINFSCELGQIMTRYDFLWARWVILSNVRTDLHLTSFYFWSTYHVHCDPDVTSYGLDEWFWAMFESTWTWHNFTFGQLFKWIVANNDQIWLSMG